MNKGSVNAYILIFFFDSKMFHIHVSKINSFSICFGATTLAGFLNLNDITQTNIVTKARDNIKSTTRKLRHKWLFGKISIYNHNLSQFLKFFCLLVKDTSIELKKCF